jgi:glycosyltransferase involved in cell wall biosynthesis
MGKRVLIFAPTVGRGGVRRVVEALCATFARRRSWTFDVLGQTYDELGDAIAWPDGWNFTQIRPVDKLPLHPELFAFLMSHRADFFAHLAEVAGDYDLIFCPSPWWAFIGSYPVETPVVSFIPDFAFDFGIVGSTLEAYFRGISPIIAKHSAHVVFPSDGVRHHGEERYGMTGSTIYFSTDIAASGGDDKYSSVRLKYGLPEQYVLAFHCYGHKGAEVIIRGQEYARRRSKYVPPLVIAGLQTQYYLDAVPVNSHVKMIQDTIRQCSGTVGRDVFILGAVSDEEMNALHVGATVAVTATRSEGGLSGTMLEAIRTGTPLVCSELDVFRERLTEWNVSFFPVDDHAALGEQLIRVCRNRIVYAGNAGETREQFAKYTMTDVAGQYIDVFERVINGR